MMCRREHYSCVAAAIFAIAASSHCLARKYPVQPDDVGLKGAGIGYQDLKVYPASGRIYLKSGVYELMDFRGPVDITEDNVTFRKCRFFWENFREQSIITQFNGRKHSNIVLEDCEVDGNGYRVSGMVGGKDLTLSRCYIHNGGDDLIKIRDGLSMDRCWLGPTIYAKGAHSDIMQMGTTLVDKSSPLVKVTNTTVFAFDIKGEHRVNNVFAFGNSLPIRYVITDNWFRGAGYQVSIGSPQTNAESFLIFRNNLMQDAKFGFMYPSEKGYINCDWSGNRNEQGELISTNDPDRLTNGRKGKIPAQIR